MLAPMTNLIADYFDDIPKLTWDQLAATATLKDEVIANLIEQGDRPECKVKAERVLTAFRIAIHQRFQIRKSSSCGRGFGHESQRRRS